MMRYQLNLRLLLILIGALALTILPLPNALVSFRPPWVLLVILYTQFFLPSYFRLVVTVILGLSLDVLLSTLLGEHVFALVITTWIASSRVRRFSLFSLPQQMVFMTLLCFLYQYILYFIDIYQGFNNSLWMVLGSTLASLMMWPWIRLLLEHTLYRGVRSRYFRQ